MTKNCNAVVFVLALITSPVVSANEMDVFDNADFEDVSKFGMRSDRVELARGFGINGNGGARIRGNMKYAFVLPFKKAFRLRKGERYVFSMDVRNNSNIRKVSGGTIADQIALEVYDRESGKCCKCYYGCGFTDIGDGWVHQELPFVPVEDLDSEKQELRFFLLLESGPRKACSPSAEKEYVDCDNACLASCKPVWRFTNTWPTHNKIWKEVGRVRAYSSFVGSFLSANVIPEYIFELVSVRGDILATARPENDNGVLVATFGALDYEGSATLIATLSIDGKPVARRFREVTVTSQYKPKKGELIVTEDGVALVDGKPFMPLGFYSHFSDRSRYTPEEVEGHFQHLQASGFNFLIDYDTWMLKTEMDRSWFYGLCEKYGLRVLASDFASEWRTQSPIPNLGEKARALAKFRPIIGWNLHDEARENGITRLELIRRVLNEATPGHVTWGCNIFAPEPYLPTVDVQGGDDYPIVVGGGTLRGMYLRMKAAAACCPALAWYVPQAFNWGNYKHGMDALTSKEAYEKLGREPSENEILAGALTYAACGVSGFIFYSYYDIFEGPFPERPALRWEALKSVAATMRSLEPFITSGRRLIELPHQDMKDETCVVVLRNGMNDVRVLVIGIGKDHETLFRIPKRFRVLKSRCGKTETKKDGCYVYRGGAISCDVLE